MATRQTVRLIAASETGGRLLSDKVSDGFATVYQRAAHNLHNLAVPKIDAGAKAHELRESLW